MDRFVRAMVIPFFCVLFPAVWYINRNLTTERLPPSIEPTPELITIAIVAAVFGSLAFAAVVAVFRRESDESDRWPSSYRQRVFQPDSTALVVFSVFIGVTLAWAVVGLAGFGPVWFGQLLLVLLVPIGLPLLILAPLAIHFHWAVILGLVFCVLWMSFVANVLSDVVHDRPVPLLHN